jgi:hypothetical protein
MNMKQFSKQSFVSKGPLKRRIDLPFSENEIVNINQTPFETTSYNLHGEEMVRSASNDSYIVGGATTMESKEPPVVYLNSSEDKQV